MIYEMAEKEFHDCFRAGVLSLQRQALEAETDLEIYRKKAKILRRTGKENLADFLEKTCVNSLTGVLININAELGKMRVIYQQGCRVAEKTREVREA